MLTLLYQYKRQKFSKMNGKEVWSITMAALNMYITGQSNSCILQLLLRQLYRPILHLLKKLNML